MATTSLCRLSLLLALALSIVAADAATITTEDGKTLPLSSDVARRVRDGRSALQRGRYDQAIAHFTAALNLRPEKQVAAIIYDDRAAARLHREDAAGTLADANEAIRLDRKLASAYSKRGLVYRRHGNRKKAISQFDAALRLNPNLPYAYNNRGLIYSDMRASDAAIRDFTAAIRINPNYSNAYHNRAVEYTKLGQYDKALADYNEAIRRDPRVQNSHINRAALLKEMGASQQARGDLDRVIRKPARHTYDFLGRGDAWFEKGEYKKAAADYRRALQLSPTHRDTLNAVAWLEATCPDASLRDGRAALQKSRKICDLTNWKNADYLETFAAACAELGDFEQAVQRQTQAIALAHTPDNRKGRMRKRLALYRGGKPFRDQPGE